MLRNEEEVLRFWEENQVFEKSIENRKNKEPFVFLDGPPFASGLPHWGHIFVSQVKDTVLRYQTQKGRYVPRRWGWDCHGVPIEAIVEKEFEIKDKRQIENEIGVEKFNQECRSKIFTYDNEWRKTIDRIGRWVDMDDQYRTLDNDFIESVWWGLGQLWNKGLIYKDYRVNLYSPSMGVPLSHTDVAMEVKYEEETIQSPVVRFSIKSEATRKLLSKVLEEVGFSLSEQQRYKTDLENRVADLKKMDSHQRHTNLRDLLNSKKPEYSGLQWENFKTNDEEVDELEFLKEQLEIVYQNIDTLEKLKNILSKDYSLNALAWTTTPWTLGSNVALTVGKEIEYSIYFLPASSELVLLAENRAIPVISLQFKDVILNSPELQKKLAEITDSGDYFEMLGYDIVKIVSLTGEDLEGLEYEPVFDIEETIDSYEQKANLHKIYTSDIVSDEDGTGIIHVAPYGPEDFDIIKERNLPLPITLNEHGEILNTVSSKLKPVFGKKYTGANPLINQILEKEGDLFGEIKYKHRVPFFDRDGKKIYYAPQEGWYIAETKLKSKSLELNEEINWVPEKLKHGRFGKGLETAPDWCISRKRYWGNPIPIWENEDKSKIIFIDSFEKLTKFAINPIYKLLNTRDLKPEFYENGKTVILTDSHSKLPLGIAATQYRSKPLSDLRKEKELNIQRFAIYGQRILEEILELFDKYDTVQLMFDEDEQALWTTWLLTLHPNSKKVNKFFYFYKSIKKNDLGEYVTTGDIKLLDLHKPMIDEIILQDQVENIYTRIPDVLDCWVESGSMPWASWHYPFENKEFVEKNIPADWIIEAQDQTRGWFRVLHILSTGIFGEKAFKNINTSGLVLASDGRKMSKKHKNYTDPQILLEKYGADAIRCYTMSSPLLNAENLAFKDKDLESTFRGTTLLLANTAKFVEFVFQEYGKEKPVRTYKHPLNKWWLAYTIKYAEELKTYLDNYDLTDASRLIEPYLNDLSTWYIRRSKDILNTHGTEFYECLRETLKIFCIYTASLQPFNTERLWSVVKSKQDPDSVHLTDLTDLPKLEDKDLSLLEKMEKVRQVVSDIHGVRKENNIRVRQPIYADFSAFQIEEGYLEIIKLECNLLDKDLSKTEGEIWIQDYDFGKLKVDLVVDKDLSVLGFTRDFERAVQSFRKKQGFRANQLVVMKWQIQETKDEEVLQKVLKNIDWEKLHVEIKWVKDLDENLDKKFEVKDLATILVDD